MAFAASPLEVSAQVGERRIISQEVAANLSSSSQRLPLEPPDAGGLPPPLPGLPPGDVPTRVPEDGELGAGPGRGLQLEPTAQSHDFKGSVDPPKSRREPPPEIRTTSSGGNEESVTDEVPARRSDKPLQALVTWVQSAVGGANGAAEKGQKYSTKSAYYQHHATADEIKEGQSAFRIWIKRLILSTPSEWFFGAVILTNFAILVYETDLRAGGDKVVPLSIDVMNHIFLLIYTIELLVRIFAFRLEGLQDPWMMIDTVIVVVGAADVVASQFGRGEFPSGTLRVVRLFRLMRLLRALKLFGARRELKILLEMMTSCMKTLFWSFLLCFMVMSMWSIIAVELLGGIVKNMLVEGFWADCDECGRYFTSVMHCNMFLFQTVIAGDSWGRISVPVMERHPWTSFIFCGALLTLIFGVLNLVVAVVVDNFAELRAKDLLHTAKDLESEERSEKKKLFKLFEQIDIDKSGEVSLKELESAAGRVPDFRHRLRVLDIDQDDLHQLFALLDRDGDGEIDPDEFIETLYRVKHTEAKTATKIIKHYLMHMLPQIQQEQARAQETEAVLKQELISINQRFIDAVDKPVLPSSRPPAPAPRSAPTWTSPGFAKGGARAGRSVDPDEDGGAEGGHGSRGHGKSQPGTPGSHVGLKVDLSRPLCQMARQISPPEPVPSVPETATPLNRGRSPGSEGRGQSSVAAVEATIPSVLGRSEGGEGKGRRAAVHARGDAGVAAKSRDAGTEAYSHTGQDSIWRARQR